MEPSRKDTNEITLNCKIKQKQEKCESENLANNRENNTNRSHIVNLTEKLPFTIKIY